MAIEFENVYYIKLGSKGQWEESSINEGKIRIGWIKQSIDDINEKKWDKIKQELKQEIHHKGVITRDLNALKKIVLSTPDDIWITFYSSYLWWCKVDNEGVKEDEISKFRTLSKKWSSVDSDLKPLIISNISGKLSKIQGFRGTVCTVKENEYLKRLINNKPSKEFIAINNKKKSLTEAVANVVKLLHWSDFETLIDILFTRSGWQRISSVGKTQKFIDMEYIEPITGKIYQVQVKSSSDLIEYNNYAYKFNNSRYERLYYVVHSPDKSLLNYRHSHDYVELLLSNRISEMVIDQGAISWLMKKIL